ncbi:hypothetical protein [Streptomyces sp. CNQ085]|uniref:hypothetical protein n=1 Tax=Streptomyces sp. CNQ085 TaxID=2886944 RepID=UPI001F509A22|nr:hypothetical protein [Streptomyces sp. CNQ085]MCI0383967.1 hypothetical protein [Streptomyces sp. CNQ085]
MAALAWLLIPFVAAVGAAVWSVWASRKPSGFGDADGVAGYEAFRAAMERPHGRGTEQDGRGGPAVSRTAPDGRAPAAD